MNINFKNKAMKMRVLKSKETNNMNTTAIISIPPCAASGALKSLHENKISCDYMGLDQSGRILMQINYGKDQDSFIKELNTFIEASEEILLAITQSINEVIQKKHDEIDKILQEHKKKYAERKIHKYQS